MNRYNIITDKNKREIVLLRGSGCIYKKCSFCDYHTDRCSDEKENFFLNKVVLSNVDGRYKNLEVINSGSVFELDKKTLNLIKEICYEKSIHTIHFESHYLYRDRIEELRKFFSDFNLKMKLGLETFDYKLRENILKKGISEQNPETISRSFDEANFLFGIKGQTVDTMKNDIKLGLKFFERICINIMCKNTTAILPDQQVIKGFLTYILPNINNNTKIDILINNTDFGVGE